MILTTERLKLRPLTLDDFEAAYSWGSNPENTRYMAWGPNNEEQARAFLAIYHIIAKTLDCYDIFLYCNNTQRIQNGG